MTRTLVALSVVVLITLVWLCLTAAPPTTVNIIHVRGIPYNYNAPEHTETR